MPDVSLDEQSWDGWSEVDGRWKRIAGTWQAEHFARDVGFAAASDLRHGHRLQRAELESRILADQPAGEIADAMGCSAEIVELYEHWFYDVRSRRAHSCWIALHAIRRKPSGELRRHDVPDLWRWIGYNAGLLALLPLLTAVERSVLSRDGIPAYLRPGTVLDPEFKLLIAAECVPTPRTAKELARLCRLTELPVASSATQQSHVAAPLAIPPGMATPAARDTAPARPVRDAALTHQSLLPAILWRDAA